MSNEQPTSTSVTSDPCTCNWLQTAADEPDNPVFFDSELNEYQLAHRTPHAYSRIYHCPFCGGAAPTSKRDTLFAQITTTESTRLAELTANIETLDAAIARFGPPDSDMPRGLTTMSPATDDEPSKVKSFRVIVYTKLSETADVSFTDYGPSRGAGMSLQSKYLGKPPPSGDPT